MEFMIRQGVLSLVFIIIGLIIYKLIAYAMDLPSKGTIEEVYITQEDKEKKKKISNKARNIYVVILIWVVILFNVITYFTTKG